MSIASTGDLPDPGIKLGSPALQVDSLPVKATIKMCLGFPGGSVEKNLPANAGDAGSHMQSQDATDGQ